MLKRKKIVSLEVINVYLSASSISVMRQLQQADSIQPLGCLSCLIPLP